MDNDSKSISIEHDDANVILDYLCPDNENSDVFDNAKKYFTQKNKNDRDIRAYTYALGEVFSNILTEKNNKKISLDNIEFVSRVETIRGTIKIIKLDKIMNLYVTIRRYRVMITGFIVEMLFCWQLFFAMPTQKFLGLLIVTYW